MNLVKFKDGKYGIRREISDLSYEYYDFKNTVTCWWGTESNFFKDCRVSLEEAKGTYDVITDTGEAVK